MNTDELYMFSRTGTVQSMEDWEHDFQNGDNDDETTWDEFLDMLYEVEKNLEDEEGYDEEYGEWRPVK